MQGTTRSPDCDNDSAQNRQTAIHLTQKGPRPIRCSQTRENGAISSRLAANSSERRGNLNCHTRCTFPLLSLRFSAFSVSLRLSLSSLAPAGPNAENRRERRLWRPAPRTSRNEFWNWFGYCPPKRLMIHWNSTSWA